MFRKFSSSIHDSLVLAISLALFIYSLFNKCYCTYQTCADSSLVFLLGWTGLFAGGFSAITWYANPLIFYSWMKYRKNPGHSFYAGLAASVLCLSFMLFDTVLTDEAGHSRKITSLESGYWLWTASALVVFAGNLFRRFRIPG